MTSSVGERDVWLASASSLVAAAAIALALGPGRPPDDASDTTPTVAVLKESSGSVRLRPAMTLGWRSGERGAEVHDGDSLFVAPGAEATLSFLDGSELALDDRSLVVIERPRGGVRSVSLRQGSVSGRAGPEGLTLNTPAGETRLEADTEAHIELTGVHVEVSVRKGTVKVKAQDGLPKTVTQGQRVAAVQTGITDLAAWPAQLLLPEPQAHLRFHGEPAPVTLSWIGAVPAMARVQIARDRLFAFLEHELPAKGGSATLVHPSKGVNWWRVVDADGRPVTEARRFTCSEDVAAVGMFPRSGEVVLAPSGTSVAFVWAPLPGITRYRVEISPSQGFEPVTVSQEATGTSTRIKLDLNEATWFWRVRAEDEAGLGMPSVPLRFRVIHKGIPDAPELLTPQIEVTP